MAGLSRTGSIWALGAGKNPFASKQTPIKKELKTIIDEVTSVKKVCMTSRSSLLNILHSLDGDKTSAPWWKIGESLATSEKDFKQGQGALLRDAVTSATETMKKMATCQVTFENELQSSLGAESPIHSMIYKDYPNLQREKESLRQKQKEVEAMGNRHIKEKQRINQLRESEKESEEELVEKENRLTDELDNANKEATQAEDRLATTLYILQAKEKDLALNMVDSLKTLQSFFRRILGHLDQDLPALEEKVKSSEKTRVYGEDLAVHLRSHKRSIAAPLSLGVKGLKNNLKEEGLFRIAPSIPTFKMLKAYIDTGGSEEVILKKYKDPHIYTAVIKYYLRELPDPLFCSAYARQWAATNAIKDDRRRMKEIDRLLDEIPAANKRNIEFLFKFLAQLTVEEVTNKMSISNLIVVLGPNLLWESDTLKTVSLEHVSRSLIEVWSSRHFLRTRSQSECENIFRRGESVVEHWEGEEVTKRSTAVRSDIKERRRQIFTTEASIENEDGVVGEEQLSFEASENQEDDQVETRSRAFNNQSESDNSDMSVSQPRTYSDSLLKLPTLNEDHVDDFLELEAKLKTAFDEEDCPEVSATSVGGGDNQARGSLGGGGGATGARNALLSGTKSSPNLKTRSYSLQTPTILEGMASSSPVPERKRRSMIPKLNFRRSRPLSFENNP